MSLILMIMIANLVIGFSVGICGIAGFLLPIFYTDVCNFNLTTSLMLSFLAFAVSGALGTYNYQKIGNFNWKMAIKLGIFSILGGFLGSKANMLMSPSTAKQLLYFMVLFSGLMLILRKNNGKDLLEDTSNKVADNTILMFLIGCTVSVICSLTGGGGPILAVPFLVLLGVKTQIAVGVALWQSIFIAIPSFFNYASQVKLEDFKLAIIVIIISHAVGVFLGSKISHKIEPTKLKKFIAYLSIVVSIVLTFRLWI